VSLKLNLSMLSILYIFHACLFRETTYTLFICAQKTIPLSIELIILNRKNTF